MCITEAQVQQFIIPAFKLDKTSISKNLLKSLYWALTLGTSKYHSPITFRFSQADKRAEQVANQDKRGVHPDGWQVLCKHRTGSLQDMQKSICLNKFNIILISKISTVFSKASEDHLGPVAGSWSGRALLRFTRRKCLSFHERILLRILGQSMLANSDEFSCYPKFSARLSQTSRCQMRQKERLSLSLFQ